MAVNSVRYAPTLSADTGRGPSNAIWSSCPVATFTQEPNLGMYFFDDFLMAGNLVGLTSAAGLSLGQWSAFADTGALIQDGNDTSGTVTPTQGGVINIGSDGDNEGVTMFGNASSFQIMTANSTTAPGYQGKLWFEARFSRSTIAATKIDCFIGLCSAILSAGVSQAAQPISTTINAMSTTPSFLGFMSSGSTASTPGGPTEIAVTFNKAAGTVNFPTNLTALMAATGQTVLAAGTFVKVGFIFDPQAYVAQVSSATARQTAGTLRRKLIRFFINGVETPAFLSADDLANATAGQAFPIVPMSPCIAVMNDAGTSPGTMSIDWIRVAQAGVA